MPRDQILTPDAPKPCSSCRFSGENGDGESGDFPTEVVPKKPETKGSGEKHT